jgi:hypothetical protein
MKSQLQAGDTIPQNLEPVDNAVRTIIVRGRYWGSVGYCFVGLLILFALADAVVSSWQDEDKWTAAAFGFVVAGVIWFSAGYVQQLERQLRKGYALKLDRQGLHHFNMPSIPWSDMGSAVIEMIESNDRKMPYLCLGLNGHTQMLIASSLWWKEVAGWEIKIHDSGRALLLPCYQINEEPHRLAHIINRHIRENQGIRS